jgi:membrane-bound metal-dependent hydrolase YbcI (DUF457 family)
VGCLLPDLVDKPIWALERALGADWANVWIARLFGHTAFFAVLVLVASRIWKTRALTALLYGIPTHLMLDIISDWGVKGGWGEWKSWLFWPFEIPRLGLLMAAVSPLRAIGYELRVPVNLYAELIGAALLLWDWSRLRARGRTA